MKNRTKNLLITGAVLCGLGIGIFGVGSLLGGKEYAKVADLNRLNGQAMLDDSNSYSLEKTRIEDINSLQVEMGYFDLQIKPSEDNNCYLAYNIRGNYTLSYEVKVDTLSIIETKDTGKKQFSFINIEGLNYIFGNKDVQYKNIVTIYIPEEKKIEDCNITLSDGNISLEGLQSEKTEINLSYGDISLNNTSLNQGSIVLGDGDIKAKNSKFVKNNLESHYGEITLENVSFEEGTIALEDGDLKADMILFEKSVQIKSSYGEVYLKMDEKAVQNLNIVADTEYGEINESGTQHYQYENADAPNNLTIESSDGDIILK